MPKSRAQTAKQPEQPDSAAPAGAEASPLEMLSAWNLEVGRFYLRRYQQYWKLPTRMQSLLTQNDFKEVQSEFFADLAADYRGQAAKLAEIAGAHGAAHGQATAPTSAETAEREYAASLLQAQEDAAAIIDQAKAQAEKILASAHKRAQAAEPAKPAEPAADEKQVRKTA